MSRYLASIPVMILLSACTPPVGDMDAIVVVFSVDTLGQAMADRTDWCASLNHLLSEYDLSAACISGGIAPSSWTGESHSRFLWPQNTAEGQRYHEAPDCGQASVLETIKENSRGIYLWGSDNMVLSESGRDKCGWFRQPFTQGTDHAYETTLEALELAEVPEEERPAHQILDTYTRKVKGHHAIELFINVIEPGGHEPRCWFNPDTAACSALWDIMVEAHLVQAEDDRRATWLDPGFHEKFLHFFSVREAKDEDRWRPLMWQTIEEAVLEFRPTMFEDRLRRILDATQAAGRLADLQLVVLGDHGENPCVLRGNGDTSLNCGHNGISTEFTGYVPVFVAPARMAEDWQQQGFVGDATHPWSTVNLAFALLNQQNIPVPADWGPMEAVGQATAWTCQAPAEQQASGVHVAGSEAIRCIAGICSYTNFEIPRNETYKPTVLEQVSASVAAYGQAPDWFSTACQEGF